MTATRAIADTPFSPPSGPATCSFNGRHPKSSFLATSEFAGNLKCVDSRDFWREVAVSPKDQGFHYNRNAETYLEVGLLPGRAMEDLVKK